MYSYLSCGRVVTRSEETSYYVAITETKEDGIELVEGQEDGGSKVEFIGCIKLDLSSVGIRALASIAELDNGVNEGWRVEELFREVLGMGYKSGHTSGYAQGLTDGRKKEMQRKTILHG